jgi:hypothetical protein
MLFVDASGITLQRGGLQYLVETAMRAAGVGDRRSPGALVHALRHTYATRLADDGATASEIMALLGHASLTTSQAYIDAPLSNKDDPPRPTGPTERWLDSPPAQTSSRVQRQTEGNDEPPQACAHRGATRSGRRGVAGAG